MISVKDFVKEYKKINSDSQVERFIKSHIIVDYVPYEKKCTICKNIVNVTSHIEIDVDGNKKKYVKVDTPTQYMIYVLSVINEYTDIEIDFKGDNSIKQFNILDSENLIDLIISKISQSEMVKFQNVFDMTKGDLQINEFSNIAIFETVCQKFNTLEMALGSMLEALEKNPNLLEAINGNSFLS